jgi:dihydroneopterin aldolase
MQKDTCLKKAFIKMSSEMHTSANGCLAIELKGLRLFAEHGLYNEEAKLGNEFELDVVLEYDAPTGIVSSIADVIDYVSAYAIIRDVFSVRRPLLETCAMEIAHELKQKFASIRKSVISIRKVTPLLTNFVGSLGVTYTKSFK